MTTNELEELKMKVGLKFGDPLEQYEIVDKLGEGSYGAVMHAKDKKKGTEHAIKQVGIDDNLEVLLREIEHMMDCKSSHIVGFDDCYLNEESLWIVMEYCESGSIADLLRLCKEPLQEHQIAYVVGHILKALECLHSHNRIHRDIKAGNILLTRNATAKLADFGVSGILSKGDVARHTVIGTPFWMAPEVIKEIGHNYKADIWSLGITIIEMAEGNPPMSHLHPMRAIFVIPTCAAPKLADASKWSNEMVDFLSKCLVKNPEDRLSAQQLLEHEWVRKHAKTKKSVDEGNPLGLLIDKANELILQYNGRDRALNALYGDGSSSSSDESDSAVESEVEMGGKYQSDGIGDCETMVIQEGEGNASMERKLALDGEEVSFDYSTFKVHSTKNEDRGVGPTQVDYQPWSHGVPSNSGDDEKRKRYQPSRKPLVQKESSPVDVHHPSVKAKVNKK